MKKLLFWGWASLAVSCLLVSCANDELAAMVANEKKEIALTACLDVGARAAQKYMCSAYCENLFGSRIDDCSNAAVLLKSPFSKLEVLTAVEGVEATATIDIPVNEMNSSVTVSGEAVTPNCLLVSRQQLVEVDVPLLNDDIEKKPFVFTAGRAWLNRGEVNT